MIGLSVTLAALAFMTAHAAILVQFIGTRDNVLLWLSIVQLGFLAGAVSFIAMAVRLSRDPRRRDASIQRSSGRLAHYWQLLPAWLIFLCLLLIVTVLLGELSIFIARLQGDQLSWLQHIPTVTVIGVCIIFCMAWILRKH